MMSQLLLIILFIISVLFRDTTGGKGVWAAVKVLTSRCKSYCGRQDCKLKLCEVVRQEAAVSVNVSAN